MGRSARIAETTASGRPSTGCEMPESEQEELAGMFRSQQPPGKNEGKGKQQNTSPRSAKKGVAFRKNFHTTMFLLFTTARRTNVDRNRNQYKRRGYRPT
jgi:hypothetical protein